MEQVNNMITRTYECVGLNKLVANMNEWQEMKGFPTPRSIEEHEAVLAKLMLVVTEIGEAAEAVRHHDMDNFSEEMADTIIRILNITGPMGIDMEKAIHDKMHVNDGRPFLHGKKY